MRWSTSIATLIAIYTATVQATEQIRTVEVLAWPLSQSKAEPLATIDYNTTLATVKTSSAAQINAADDLVRVGFLQPDTKLWSGVVTSASSFGHDRENVIVLQLDTNGDLYHVDFRTRVQSKAASDQRAELRAEVVQTVPGPFIHLNKPVVLNAEGEMDKPAEKSFLQKYWWAIAGFLLLQVVLGGGGGDKKE